MPEKVILRFLAAVSLVACFTVNGCGGRPVIESRRVRPMPPPIPIDPMVPAPFQGTRP